ncbi:MAG: hypothetical protein PVJ67_03075 [Candidatus Pacearchaeota archaeon]|jgi:chromosome segregation ATPase
MFDFLKKKKEGEENSAGIEGETNSPVPSTTSAPVNSPAATPQAASQAASTEALKAEIEKIKAGVEAFGEVRKSFGERFNQMSENIGELRQMIMDRDKTMQEIELKALKAYDLVSTVQPEKTMIEIQKQEAKIEALNANLEGNEAIMDRVMEELKEAKRKIEFFRGVEEIVKLSEETKKELIEIKKVESKININADKVETLYAEMRRKFQRLDVFDSELKEMKVTGEQNLKDVGMLKEKSATLATKDELGALVLRVKKYIEVLKALEKKSSMTRDIDKLRGILESLR